MPYLSRYSSAAQRELQVTRGFTVVGLMLLGISCHAGPMPADSNFGVPRTQRNQALSGVVVHGAGLNLRAFVAQMAFVFPTESAELARSLVRTEMARLESERLGLVIPQARIDQAFAEFSNGLSAQLGAEVGPDDWALTRHHALWREVQPLYRKNLAANLLYQVVLRADARQSGRVGMFWFVSGDPAQARSWASGLKAGRSPQSMVAESLLAGPNPDGSYPPMSRDLPGVVGEQLQNPTLGQVIGPIQLEGDRSWRVGFVTQVLAPEAELPPVDRLLEELASQPIDALEARAWFEKMSRRYTVSTSLSPFSGPPQAFEFSR